MTYAADVWYTPTRKKEGAKKTSGSVGIMKRLASVQRMGSTAITGVLGTTPTDLLDLHAGLWPVHLMLHRICHRAATRLASLPVLHPLYKLYRIRAKHYIKTHRSPLHELAASYSITPERMETRDLARLPPAYEVKARITLAGQDEEQDTGGVLGDGEVELYSDGSGLDGMAGAAAVMFKGAQGAKTLRYSLGQLTEHTVYEVEAVGVILTLHMLGSERNIQRATIRLDNKAVLGALTECRSRPAQMIIDEIISKMESVWHCASDPAFRLEIGWVKGHSGNEGNEKADLEAREAAKGRSSRV